MVQRIISILIIATVAIGSIYYLYYDLNYKISQYAMSVTKRLIPLVDLNNVNEYQRDDYIKSLNKKDKARLKVSVDYYIKEIMPISSALGNNTGSDSPIAILAIPEYKRDFILDYFPYVKKTKQRFVIYSASIIVTALILSAIALLPQRRKKEVDLSSRESQPPTGSQP